VEIKVGDIYIRHSDGQICRVKWIGHATAVLESEDGSRLRLIDIFDLEKTYTKKRPKFPQ
jgi:L-ascorbate metabolism protein UlaG (beta-lactamase superfamily)